MTDGKQSKGGGKTGKPVIAVGPNSTKVRGNFLASHEKCFPVAKKAWLRKVDLRQMMGCSLMPLGI